MSNEPGGRYRPLSPRLRHLVQGLAILLICLGGIYAMEVHLLLGFAIFRQQFLGLVLALGLAIVFLTVPARHHPIRSGLPWYDWLLAALGGICGLYVTIRYPTLAYSMGFPSWDKLWFGTTAILLVLEATRRIFGLVLVAIAATFILYARFADFFPGVLATNGIEWERLAGNLFIGTNGMLGVALDTLATVVLVFILFGELMFASGGGSLFTDLATSLMGRFRGGPAKVAVLGSALFGSISGSAVANVAITGTVTIPLMKRLGYRPALAGAVEATASTGGLVTPPVMGAVSFLMAEFLQIPYREVILAAVIPALLYYTAILLQVDLEAARTGMKGLARHEVPRITTVLRQGWVFLLPLAVLLYTLMGLYWQPARSGMAAVLLVAVIALWRPEHRTLGWWVQTLSKAGRSVAEITVIGALVGLIIASSDFTGLGFSLSLPLLKLGEVNLILFLAVTAVISLVLGMGLPGIAIYMMQTALVVPALVKMGIVPIAAHFFIQYFGVFSMITPPVCVSAMAAAAIAKSDPWETGWESVKLGIVAFVIPFMFVLSPSLLFQGEPWRIFANLCTALVGVLAVGVGLRGFFYSGVGTLARLLLVASAFCLLLPVGAFELAWAVNATGLSLTGVVLLVNVWRSRRPGRREAASA